MNCPIVGLSGGSRRDAAAAARSCLIIQIQTHKHKHTRDSMQSINAINAGTEVMGECINRLLVDYW